MSRRYSDVERRSNKSAYLAIAFEILRLRKPGASLLRAIAIPAARRCPIGYVEGGLVQFRIGLPITKESGGAEWLALHLAGYFGQVDLHYTDRIAWTLGRKGLWERMAQDSLSNLEWAGPTVSDPWSALAAVLELAAFRKAGFGMVSRLPIPLSAASVAALKMAAIRGGTAPLPTGILERPWAGCKALAEMAVLETGVGVFSRSAATAGLLADSLQSGTMLLRSITTGPSVS